MASRTCWHCGIYSHQTPTAPARNRRGHQQWYAPCVCDECGSPSLCFAPGNWQTADQVRDVMSEVRGDFDWLPVSAPGRVYEDVPQPIAAAANEAHMALNIGAYRAAVLMSRAVVEATAKDKDVTTGTLAEKIDKMHAEGMVRELVKDAAHEIRYLGNEMAHGDFVASVSKEEVEEILELMAEVLHDVYQAPSRLEARKAARLARQQESAST